MGTYMNIDTETGKHRMLLILRFKNQITHYLAPQVLCSPLLSPLSLMLWARVMLMPYCWLMSRDPGGVGTGAIFFCPPLWGHSQILLVTILVKGVSPKKNPPDAVTHLLLEHQLQHFVVWSPFALHQSLRWLVRCGHELSSYWIGSVIWWSKNH